MIIIDLVYIKSLEEVNKHLEAHRAFLKKHYNTGELVISGPKNPRINGGIILALTTLETAKSLMKEDPFYQHDIAEYSYIEFISNQSNEQLKEIVTKDTKINRT